MKEANKYLLLVLFFTFPLMGSAQNESLVSFEIEDQFGREYRDKDFMGKMIVIIGSDGGGSKYNRQWGKTLSDALKEDKTKKYEISWIGVADLRNVPFFMKGYIRNQFSEDEDEWVLMDWDGIIPEAYDFESRKSNILVFNSKGQLVLQTVGEEVNRGQVDRIVEVIIENY